MNSENNTEYINTEVARKDSDSNIMKIPSVSFIHLQQLKNTTETFGRTRKIAVNRLDVIETNKFSSAIN